MLPAATVKLWLVTFQMAQWLNLGLLVVLAGLLLALLFGTPVPRPVFAAVIVAQAGVRSWRDLRWGGEARRRRVGFNLLLSVALAWLVMVAV